MEGNNDNQMQQQQSNPGGETPKSVVPSLDKIVDSSLVTHTNDNNDNKGNTPPQGDKPVETSGATAPDKKDVNGDSNTSNPNTPSDINPEPTEYDSALSILATEDTVLTETDRQLKHKVIGLVKGAGSNNRGEVVNSKGEVVLSQADLKQLILSGDLPKNAQGQFVNSLGEVLETVTQEPTVLQAVKSIAEDLNFEISDDFISTAQDTPEGIANAMKDIAKVSRLNAVASFLQANPQVGDFFRHLQLGGEVEAFTTSAVDYNKVDLKTLDRESKLELVKSLYNKKGITNSKAILDVLSKADEDAINSASTDALKELKAHQIKEQKDSEAAYNAKVEADNKALQMHWEERKKVITKGEIAQGINIPEADRNAFFDYIAKPINDNMESQYNIDEASMGVEDELLLAYLRFKKGNLGTLIDSRVKSMHASSLENRIAKFTVVGNVDKEVSNKGSKFPTLEKITGQIK